MWQTAVDNIKTILGIIGACVAGLTGCAGGYVALDGPIPASKQYVIAENLRVERRAIDTQLQVNTVQRNLLRKERFDRDIELQKEPPPMVRSILNQRIDQIKDELDNIEKEREELRKEKAQK